MDSLAKIVEQAVPFMAMVNGKPKLNTSRVIEISFIIAVLWHLITGLTIKVEAITDSIGKVEKEIIKHQTKTEERLGVLERDMTGVRNVIYKPINGG